MDKELSYAYKMHFRVLANNLVLFSALPKWALSLSLSLYLSLSIITVKKNAYYHHYALQ